MVDDHNPDQTESKPLNTELETLAPEATADHTDLSSESTSNPSTRPPQHRLQHVPTPQRRPQPHRTLTAAAA